jgi:hypothetical protein
VECKQFLGVKQGDLRLFSFLIKLLENKLFSGIFMQHSQKLTCECGVEKKSEKRKKPRFLRVSQPSLNAIFNVLVHND